MHYCSVVPGIFIERPNRFIAYVKIGDDLAKVHVKNTGRCNELLIQGTEVYLSKSDNLNRKTQYDLIAVKKRRPGLEPLLINMDSQIPNDATDEWLRKGTLFSPQATIRREVKYKKSRFDFYVEDGKNRCFVEVKGVTLEQNGTALFPDAPTERGIRHIQELTASLKEGYMAFILFVVQMKGVSVFRPNFDMQREFGLALQRAAKAGVKILAMDCRVTPDSLELAEPVTIDISAPLMRRKSCINKHNQQNQIDNRRKQCQTSKR